MDRACAAAEQAPKTDANHALALWIMSVIHFYRNIHRWGENAAADLDVSHEMAEHLIRADGNSVRSYMARAWSHLNAGDFDRRWPITAGLWI